MNNLGGGLYQQLLYSDGSEEYWNTVGSQLSEHVGSEMFG